MMIKDFSTCIAVIWKCIWLQMQIIINRLIVQPPSLLYWKKCSFILLLNQIFSKAIEVEQVPVERRRNNV